MPTTWRPHQPRRAAITWRSIPMPIYCADRGHIRRMIRAPYPVVAATVRREIIDWPEDAA